MNWKDFLPKSRSQWTGIILTALAAAFVGGVLF
jgi:hypothetical protein